MGFGLATVRSRRYAVSSRVSVPCVMTTPSTRESARTLWTSVSTVAGSSKAR
jgi:hypothetical protein